MHKQVLAITLVALAVSGCAMAQTPKAEDGHSAHHPPGGALSASAPAPINAPPASGAFEQQMKAMQAMHLRRQAAKTPTEHAALMDEHMKLMQSGMAMMKQMMKMMVDREAAMPRK